MVEKILIIDDHPDTRLRKHRFETAFAADAAQAIAVACQTRSNAIGPDLGLPGGNGIDRMVSELSVGGQLAGGSVLQVMAG